MLSRQTSIATNASVARVVVKASRPRSANDSLPNSQRNCPWMRNTIVFTITTHTTVPRNIPSIRASGWKSQRVQKETNQATRKSPTWAAAIVAILPPNHDARDRSHISRARCEAGVTGVESGDMGSRGD